MKILTLITLVFILSSCSLLDNEKNNWNNTNQKIELTEEEKSVKEEEDKKEKIDTLRKRLALRWLIQKWDLSLQNKEYTSALIKYLQIHKEIPNDDSTTEKIWDIYFNLQNYKQAYSYYEKIKDYESLNKNRVAVTLLTSMELNEKNILFINSELNTLWLNEDELFYYSNSLVCIEDFSLCKQHFQDYFEEKESENKNIVNEWTWTLENTEVKNELFKELNNIKTALQNYENFQVDDLVYKWALVSWAFFENWLYPIAIQTSKKLLEERKDYKPLLKLVAKSNFEIWNYVEAKVYLLEYNKLIKKNDPEASYFLWVVYEKLHEYVLSTIHFKKALSTWYEATLDVNKRILFNYYELWEIDKMLESFQTIINENKSELKIDDYDLAIYYHIVNEKVEDAKKITIEWLEKFPDSEVFNWYMWWIVMEEINSKPVDENTNKDINLYSEAEKYIDKWMELNPKNPMLTLVKWKIEVSKNDLQKAFIYFKKTISLDNNWDFWKIAKQELDNIKNEK